MSHFIDVDRNTAYLLPPSVDEWLPGDHLARFVVEAIEQLDLSALTRKYAGRGSRAYHPAVLLAILIYGYATGVFSSRKLERATYDSLAFRFIAANTHPDHDTLANFRSRFLDEIAALFVQVLQLAQQMQLLQLGTVCLDGTKVKANASRHSALSHGHMSKLQAQLELEVQELMALAEEADGKNIPDGMSLPHELALRQDRLAAMQQAQAKLAERARQRYAQEKVEFDAKMQKRAAKERATGKKSSGPAPKPPQAGIRDKDQINLTDEDSRIMPIRGKGFEQAYNAQAGVDANTMLVVAVEVTQAPNDKEQVQPMLHNLQQLQEQVPQLGAVEHLIADTGYCSEANIQACEQADIDPLISVARQDHHPHWSERHTEPEPLQGNPGKVQRMGHKLKTKAGAARYAVRKQTVEPVFGIIKSVLGFRQFSLRGLNKVAGEWALVCLAWNLKRMAVLRLQTAKAA